MNMDVVILVQSTSPPIPRKNIFQSKQLFLGFLIYLERKATNRQTIIIYMINMHNK